LTFNSQVLDGLSWPKLRSLGFENVRLGDYACDRCLCHNFRLKTHCRNCNSAADPALRFNCADAELIRLKVTKGKALDQARKEHPIVKKTQEEAAKRLANFHATQEEAAKRVATFHGTKKKNCGIVVHWVEEKGFGFIRASDSTELFVHRMDLRGVNNYTLTVGDKVEFLRAFDPHKGKICAKNVTVQWGKHSAPKNLGKFVPLKYKSLTPTSVRKQIKKFAPIKYIKMAPRAEDEILAIEDGSLYPDAAEISTNDWDAPELSDDSDDISDFAEEYF